VFAIELMCRARLVCTVSKGQEAKRPGPFASSRHDEVQFEFREGGCNEVRGKNYSLILIEIIFLFEVFTFKSRRIS
jgi:hypothetical protein